MKEYDLKKARGEGMSKGFDVPLGEGSINGMFAIRAGPWKLAFCAGSGGWGKPSDAEAAKKGFPAAQLYNLADDPTETRNLYTSHAAVTARLATLLERYIADGRSTPGAKLTNDVPVRWRSP